jgi:hypothetical protein
VDAAREILDIMTIVETVEASWTDCVAAEVEKRQFVQDLREELCMLVESLFTADVLKHTSRWVN